MDWFYWEKLMAKQSMFGQFRISQRCRRHQQCRQNQPRWRRRPGTVEMTSSRMEGGRNSFVWTALLKIFHSNAQNNSVVVTYGGEVKRWLFYGWPHFLWALCKNQLADKSIWYVLTSYRVNVVYQSIKKQATRVLTAIIVSVKVWI